MSQFLLGAVVVVVMGLAIVGVGMGSPPQTDRAPSAREVAAAQQRLASGGVLVREGRAQFASRGCGNCHAIAAIGAHGELGPRLDTGIPINEDDIVAPRIARFSTQYSRLMPTDFARRMTPAEVVAVAAFINTVSSAGRGDARRPDRAALVREGRQVFLSAGCGSCHAVASVHSQGQEGPDLDTSELLTRAQIRVRLNLGEGGMPSFRDRLTPRQQEAVTEFVLNLRSQRP